MVFTNIVPTWASALIFHPVPHPVLCSLPTALTDCFRFLHGLSAMLPILLVMLLLPSSAVTQVVLLQSLPE